MRLFTFLFFFCFLSCNQSERRKDITDAKECTAKHENSIEHTQQTTNDPIEFIRQQVEAIHTSSLEKKHFEFTCDEKMMVDYFYHENEIVKIAIDFGWLGDTHAKEDYYYHNGQLIFFYEFVEGGPACEGCIETNEYRSYIRNNKTVRYLKNKDQQPCRKCHFDDRSKPYKLLKASDAQSVKAILCPT